MVIIMIICTVIYIVIFEVLLVIWILIRYNKNVCEGTLYLIIMYYRYKEYMDLIKLYKSVDILLKQLY